MSYITPTNTRIPHKRLFIYNQQDWDNAAESHPHIHILSNSIWNGPEWGLKGPPRKHWDMLGVYPPPPAGASPHKLHWETMLRLTQQNIWYMRCF